MKKIDEIVRDYNMSDVDKSDREMVRSILKGLLLFDSTIPILETSVEEKDDHYNLQIRGYKQTIISLKLWYEEFLASRRQPDYDAIISATCIASPETGTGPVFNIKIARPNYAGPFEKDDTYFAVPFASNMEIEYNESDVDRVDRPYVRKILRRIMTFDKVMPRLEPKISPKKDHYNLIIQGWKQPFDVEKWYNTFESIKRDSQYDHVIETGCAPAVTDMGPVLLVRIARTEFSETVVDKSQRRRSKKRFK
jgi:hypothetical protein